MNAIISSCEKYRYVLTRSLDSIVRWHRPVLFIMLNPSTADATQDDPTIRRCVNFAKREGMTQLTVVNLFAYRVTDPKELLRAENPIGPENDHHLFDEIAKHELTIAAWGSHPFAKERAAEVIKKFGASLMCLGTTKDGSPRHPLYLKNDAVLRPLTLENR
jgi:hypothetical protein